MDRTSFVVSGLLALLLAGCVGDGWENHAWFLHRKGVEAAGTERFQVCDSYGCERVTQVSLTPEEWQRVRDQFAVPARSAAEERVQIAQAVGVLEGTVGPKVGYHKDVAGTFNGGGGHGQLDCVDETVNTTVFLALMREDGLLKYHQLRGPAGRGHFFSSWPHQSAVVTEASTGEDYAIDSWFHDNGQAAEVVPLERWLDGWAPPGFEDSPL